MSTVVADAGTWAGVIVALVFGLWGAVLSTINTVSRHREKKEAERRDVFVTGRSVMSRDSGHQMMIVATNCSPRPIEIRRVGILGDQEVGVWYGPQPAHLPARLEQDQSVLVEIVEGEDWVNLVLDSTQQKRIVAFMAEDSYGHEYRTYVEGGAH